MTGSPSARDIWRPGFHLLPPAGWVNDPNGLCQFEGTYHVFCQCSPDWPALDATRGWGHLTSRDLVTWEWQGMALMPDTADDATGAYSGSAFVGDDGLLHLVYTGNVKLPGKHDYITSGRLANQIEVTSADGEHLSSKRVVLRNADYPSWCSCHVRDPKVWRQAGTLHMLLGARGLDSEGAALVYRSDDDGATWELEEEVRPGTPGAFGYMWECPDRVSLDGHEYLAFCPQGLEHGHLRFQNVYQSGYVPLEDRLLSADAMAEDGVPLRHVDVDDFREWDLGFDFYAPQTFATDDGRTVLIGWAGLPDVPYGNPTGELGWMHCLTVPRELTRGSNGTVCQRPVGELARLRGNEAPLLDDEVTFEHG
ncbi:MAG: glycoside hydrolase family 32 protein, partial [Atopobiaceae bacterium]|nr:glycoside hydrolase family 32 protein [Atopobiaceae bacterium]